MKTLIALLLTCWSLAAQNYSYVFTNVPLWDITGPFTASFTNGASFHTITGSVVLQANGQFTGTRTEIDTFNGDYLEGSGLIKGRLSSTPSEIELRYGWKGTYSRTVNGSYESATANGHGGGVLVPAWRSLALNEALRVCVAGRRCSTSVWGIELPLQPEMDGTWQLDITLFTQSPKLTGQAVVTLPTGRGFGYQVSGTQNLKTGSMIFRLKGMNDASTSFLTLDTQGFNQGTVVKLRGRLLGQKLKFPLL